MPEQEPLLGALAIRRRCVGSGLARVLGASRTKYSRVWPTRSSCLDRSDTGPTSWQGLQCTPLLQVSGCPSCPCCSINLGIPAAWMNAHECPAACPQLGAQRGRRLSAQHRRRLGAHCRAHPQSPCAFKQAARADGPACSAAQPAGRQAGAPHLQVAAQVEGAAAGAKRERGRGPLRASGPWGSNTGSQGSSAPRLRSLFAPAAATSTSAATCSRSVPSASCVPLQPQRGLRNGAAGREGVEGVERGRGSLTPGRVRRWARVQGRGPGPERGGRQRLRLLPAPVPRRAQSQTGCCCG
jgi:hypothetical protein